MGVINEGVSFSADTEFELINSFNDELAKESDPFKRAVLNTLKDTMPGLCRATLRELDGSIDPDDTINYITSVIDSLLDTMAATAARDNLRTSVAIQTIVTVRIRDRLRKALIE